MIGTQIGPFVRLRLPGTGGMASVYFTEHSLTKISLRIELLVRPWAKVWPNGSSLDRRPFIIHPVQTTTLQRSW
jgi:hypothetical protein